MSASKGHTVSLFPTVAAATLAPIFCICVLLSGNTTVTPTNAVSETSSLLFFEEVAMRIGAV